MKRPDSQHSPISAPTGERLRRAIALSLALHIPVVFQAVLKETWENKASMAYVAKEDVKSALYSHTLEKSKYVDELKEALERGERIDLGGFYLKSQYLDGRLGEDNMHQSISKLASVEAEVRADRDKMEALDVLQSIRDRQGRYDEPRSYLSTILLDKKGNCQARERFTATLIDRVYPNMEIAYQVVKLNGVKHTRTLAKVDGQWRNMEDPKALTLTADDLEGTVLYSKYDYVKHYVGKQGVGDYIEPSVAINSSGSDRSPDTDDYLDIPLPPGVSITNIKDVGSDASEANEASLGRVGQGAIGTPAPVGKNGQVVSSVGGFARNPTEFEFFTVDDIEKNRQRTQDTLKHWKNINATPPQWTWEFVDTYLPNMHPACMENIVPIVEIGAKNILESCRLEEVSGLFSCDTYSIIPPGVADMDFEAMSCQSTYSVHCSAPRRKDRSFMVDSYLRWAFIISLEHRFMGDQADESSRERVRRVALELGVIDQSVYKNLVRVIHHEGGQFMNVTENNFAVFRMPNGKLNAHSVGNTFDDFYCMEP